MSEYEIGDTRPPSDGNMWVAGISRCDEENRHGNQIEVYGKRIFYGFHDWIFSVGFRVHQLP